MKYYAHVKKRTDMKRHQNILSDKSQKLYSIYNMFTIEQKSKI